MDNRCRNNCEQTHRIYQRYYNCKLLWSIISFRCLLLCIPNSITFINPAWRSWRTFPQRNRRCIFKTYPRFKRKTTGNRKQTLFNIYDCNNNIFLNFVCHNVYFPSTNYGINYFKRICGYD